MVPLGRALSRHDLLDDLRSPVGGVAEAAIRAALALVHELHDAWLLLKQRANACSRCRAQNQQRCSQGGEVPPACWSDETADKPCMMLFLDALTSMH